LGSAPDCENETPCDNDRRAARLRMVSCGMGPPRHDGLLRAGTPRPESEPLDVRTTRRIIDPAGDIIAAPYPHFDACPSLTEQPFFLLPSQLHRHNGRRVHPALNPVSESSKRTA
jgi:hypothetical protein